MFYQLQVSPAPAVATFGDVPTTHPFFQFIEALVASGITAGCGGGQYCPDAPLTRGQMAVFLSKGLGLHFAP
ncbi:MAG TPA: S-layer homology domain-containing protein [Gemmatimonadales bacterium]|nr:S-layer homology domain-containing protein [Gemmatimonadales bacterium]